MSKQAGWGDTDNARCNKVECFEASSPGRLPSCKHVIAFLFHAVRQRRHF